MWRDLSVNFVVSLKTENLTEGKFCFVNFTKKFLKGFAKRQNWSTHISYTEILTLLHHVLLCISQLTEQNKHCVTISTWPLSHFIFDSSVSEISTIL